VSGYWSPSKAGEPKLGLEHPRTINSLRERVNLFESWVKPDEAAKWRSKLAKVTIPGMPAG